MIKTVDLYKSYSLGKESIPVLKQINCSVAKGEYVAIMGQSGAGKSTLLNIFGCLDTPTSGEYFLNGTSVASLSESRLADIRNREIGFVFQNFNLLSKLTVEANIELPLIYRNVNSRARKRMVDEALDRFGLTARRRHKPNEISGGQKQRVAIARAVVKKPSIILADEPTGNLDTATAEEILALFDGLRKDGNTLVVITHEHDVAARSQRIIRLIDGKIVA
ncbi:MAG: ABC transporter ATP-binding protein [Chitinivibrionales bacterium]|nr:ABC transporter ATP-binding protein [Chitinivibrionales bacterium]